MTLKQTFFELGFLISHAFIFQVFNATGNWKSIRATHSFLDFNQNFMELKSGIKSLLWHVFCESILPPVLHLMGVRG